jgi:hypothetical protein
LAWKGVHEVGDLRHGAHAVGVFDGDAAGSAAEPGGAGELVLGDAGLHLVPDRVESELAELLPGHVVDEGDLPRVGDVLAVGVDDGLEEEVEFRLEVAELVRVGYLGRRLRSLASFIGAVEVRVVRRDVLEADPLACAEGACASSLRYVPMRRLIVS